jgi:hypothetical protein
VFWKRNSSQHHSLRDALRRDAAMRLCLAVFLVFLAGQGLFWHHTRAIKPEMGIVPDVPGDRAVRALSFGDEEAFFRLLALNIQSSGDTFGRFTALYKYDFNKLYHWFRLLDRLNRESNYLPSMASYYFSQTQNPDDVRYLVDYLDEYTMDRPKEKWWWIVQASYMASHKLKNMERALAMASRLRGVTGIPIWAQQLPAFLHEQRGEFGEALAIIEDILKHPEQYSQGELNFMMYFVKERIHRFDSLKADFERAQKEMDALRAKGVPEPQPMGPPTDVGAPTLGGE